MRKFLSMAFAAFALGIAGLAFAADYNVSSVRQGFISAPGENTGSLYYVSHETGQVDMFTLKDSVTLASNSSSFRESWTSMGGTNLTCKTCPGYSPKVCFPLTWVCKPPPPPVQPMTVMSRNFGLGVISTSWREDLAKESSPSAPALTSL